MNSHSPLSVLVIGGTRNLGHELVHALLGAGHRVTTLNRGITPDQLPAEVERLHADRGDAAQLASALGARGWDAVVDTTLYDGPEARLAVEMLDGRTGRYLWISTGQVYLVRLGIRPPFREADYPGPAMPAPPSDHPADLDGWRYGVEKRAAEDLLAEAASVRGFPAVSLRLPMVHSPRDHYARIPNYLHRLRDGGPILLPDGPLPPVRHVFAADVVAVVLRLLVTELPPSSAYNLGSDDALPLDEYLGLLAQLAGAELRLLPMPRERLEAAGLLPAASPFSGRWMSELDNQRSRQELGVAYTPVREYLARLVAEHDRDGTVPAGYAQRPAELQLARTIPS